MRVDRCLELFVVHWRTQKEAIVSARQEGWRIRDGLWCCPMHVSDLDAPAQKGEE